ncbi:Alpha/beta hydrolase domain-containing protein 11 [Orchesella cincta]|uniref:sn-1-specific diacylglycerol lipase ABHD11 n=1 Tax=Orchesella cincta TaxID=48709 RepID=A0A1D2M3F1_ORCCI|nr:Alpha/beta hydrolase domain-containing protein 11 [Orchesella cincta]
MAEDIIKKTQFLKLDKFSLLGHSMGGKTAMTVALKHPELLDKLVVVDITPVEKWLDSQAVKGHSHRDFLTTYLGDGDRRVVWTGKPSLDIIIENIEELIGFPIALLDLKYNKPALFIKGENSTCVSDSLFPNTQKIFTNAKLTKIRNAGHFPHLSNTKDFMEVVLSFLSKP